MLKVTVALFAIIGVLVSYIAIGERTHSKAQRKITELLQVNAKSTAAIENMRAEAKQSLVIRENYLRKLQEYEKTTASLRDSIDTNSKQLRVETNCNASLPQSTNAGRTQGGTAELDRSARQAYFDLRKGIIKVQSLLYLCREELARYDQSNTAQNNH